MEANFSEEQAEAVVNTIKKINLSHLATKADIEKSRAGTKADMQDMKVEMKALDHKIEVLTQATKADLKDLEQRLIIKVGGMFIVTVSVILGYATFLVRSIQL